MNKMHLFYFAGAAIAGYFLASKLNTYPVFSNAYLAGSNFYNSNH